MALIIVLFFVLFLPFLYIYNHKKKTYLGQIKGGTLASIIVVAVHVEDLLALDREKSREDTLGEAGAENDDIVLLIL